MIDILIFELMFNLYSRLLLYFSLVINHFIYLLILTFVEYIVKFAN